MRIIGLNHGEINSSAAMVSDGIVVTGAPEERFSRQKFTKAFPHGALAYCLEHASVALEDCDAVAQAWNPGASWHKFNPLISAQRSSRESYFYSIADNLMQHTSERRPGEWVRIELDGTSGLPPLYYVQHHRSHAANAFFLSHFEEAAILTCDFRGEYECTTFGKGSGNRIEVLDVQHIPHSLGMFYATFTELLGYRPDNDEWKVMALSAFDVQADDFIAKLRSTFSLRDEGRLILDQTYYKGAILDQPHNYTDQLVELLGGRIGRPDEEFSEWHCRVARAMQVCAEDIGFHYLKHLHRLTGCDAVVLAGGFMMNSVFNGKVLQRSPFERVYIPYAPSDAGNSIGAALYTHHCILGGLRVEPNDAPYIGPEFTDTEIVARLERRRIHYEVHDNIADVTARLLADGNIVAVFNGRMEFGDRALGNRSILADPRKTETKDRINAIIKYRESYRPFAPVVLSENMDDIFDVEDGFTGWYMEKVVPIRSNWRDKLGAVSHVDGSGRVQTVTRERNNWLYDVVDEFNRLTGVPVVLNTSFNINGEPIVLTPDDALTTFFNSGLETLVVGNCLVRKSDTIT